MSRELWDQVQTLLASHRRKRSNATSGKPRNLLAGILFDDRDNPMSTSHATKGARRYRYYVSRPLLQRDPDSAGSIPRVPAHAIEDLVSSHIEGLLLAASRKSWKKVPPGDRATHLREAIQRVELRAREVEITLSKEALDPQAVQTRQSIPEGNQISQRENALLLRLPVRLKTWGGEKLIHAPGGKSFDSGGRPDKALIKAVVRAFEWRKALEKGEVESLSDLAQRAGCTCHYAKRILKLGFLAPDITERILRGRQPHGINLSQILRLNLPLSWKAQRELLGFFPDSPA